MAKSSARGRSLTPPQVVSMLVVFLTLSCVGGVLSAGFAAPFVGATAALTKASAELFEELPSDFNVQPPSQISTLLASDGSEITKFYAENRIVVPLSSISVNMQNAIVAVEDQRFYQHQGVDPTGMVRALVSNNAGGSRQGASTLTQQYVRNTLIETGLKNDDHKLIRDATESTVARKLREMKFALSLEQKYSKQQILEGYLNIAAFSPSTYGVEASSLHYFNKHAKDLTVAEAALLAGTTNAPSAYDPKSQPELAKNRRDWVLAKMLEEKFITKQQYDEAVNSEIKLDIQDSPAGCGAAGSYAYFCTYVVNEILGSENFGPNVAARRQLLTRGGLKITTTLNLERHSGQNSDRGLRRSQLHHRLDRARHRTNPGAGSEHQLRGLPARLRSGRQARWNRAPRRKRRLPAGVDLQGNHPGRMAQNRPHALPDAERVRAEELRAQYVHSFLRSRPCGRLLARQQRRRNQRRHDDRQRSHEAVHQHGLHRDAQGPRCL